MPEEIDTLCKDAFVITSRLFDHRAVIKSEAKYLVREMELKRNKERLKNFHSIIQQSDRTMERIPECVDLLNERVETLHTLVVSAASKGLDVLSVKNNQEDAVREEYKKKREKEWEDFMAEMNKAQADVIRKHEERMNELTPQKGSE